VPECRTVLGGGGVQCATETARESQWVKSFIFSLALSFRLHPLCVTEYSFGAVLDWVADTFHPAARGCCRCAGLAVGWSAVRSSWVPFVWHWGLCCSDTAGPYWGLLLMSFPQMSGFVTNQYILWSLFSLQHLCFITVLLICFPFVWWDFFGPARSGLPFFLVEVSPSPMAARGSQYGPCCAPPSSHPHVNPFAFGAFVE